VDIARATAELHDTVRAGHLADCLAGASVRGEAATRVAGHPGRARETVQALAGLDVQVVFVPELVAAARAADADGERVAQGLPVVLPTGHDPGGGCLPRRGQGRHEAPDLASEGVG